MVSHLFLIRESLKQIVLGIVGQLSTTNNKSSPSEQVPPCYSIRIFDYGPPRWRDPVSAHGFKENYIWCILKGRYRSKFMPYGTMRFSKYTVNLNHLMWVFNRVLPPISIWLQVRGYHGKGYLQNFELGRATQFRQNPGTIIAKMGFDYLHLQFKPSSLGSVPVGPYCIFLKLSYDFKSTTSAVSLYGSLSEMAPRTPPVLGHH
jgi:hypothetical protein